jgi:crotonobetainyl-CoA:carnitine CoA-transferase CaiB-like acyl-CoA transferase
LQDHRQPCLGAGSTICRPKEPAGQPTRVDRGTGGGLCHSPTHEWVEKLTGLGVPAGPVWSVSEALAHPQLADRGLMQTHRIGSEDLQLVGIGAKLDGVAPRVGSPPPALGAHTNEILTELGYDNNQISDLKKEGAI